ncbi:hypothetical protein [Actinocrispum wychmicini]|uniref:Uncharacterized protein n=1 Tax=Actinocrispum wychmicini TaxID=1213861 RepID=A0A4R2JKB1_9PSEU|nr:hypothetical protein [Actinocrispum wychmicini]TCO59247.1 hypothetical protein EV192_10488 [Actinocrispum wychmicini]
MSDRSAGSSPIRTVSAIMGVAVGLTFLFGFGNVLNLALRLGVPVWIAPLIAPALDLSVLGLLRAVRFSRCTTSRRSGCGRHGAFCCSRASSRWR